MKHAYVERIAKHTFLVRDAKDRYADRRGLPWRYCERCGCSEGMIEQMGWTSCRAIREDGE